MPTCFTRRNLFKQMTCRKLAWLSRRFGYWFARWRHVKFVMLINIIWTDGTILFSASFRSLQSATMQFDGFVVIGCGTGRVGVAGARRRVCVSVCGRRRWHLSGKAGRQAGGCTGMQRRKVYSNELNVSRRHGARPGRRGGTECSWAAALPRRAPQECEKLNTARVHSAPGAHTARLRPQHPTRADRSKIRFFYRSSLPPVYSSMFVDFESITLFIYSSPRI